MDPPYRSPARLGRVLQVGFAILTVLGGATFGLSLVRYLLVDRLIDDPLSVTVSGLEASEDRRFAVGVAYLVAVVFVGIAFIAWTYRSYRNLRALGARPRFEAGWAIGAWFVPVLNLWRPKQIIDEIWRASDPDAGRQGGPSRVPFLVHAWWGAWVVGVVLNYVVRATDVQWVEATRLDALLWLAADAVWLTGAVLAFWVVTLLSRCQNRAAERRAVTGRAPGAFVAEQQPSLATRSPAVPAWVRLTALPAVALVVAVCAAVIWDPGTVEVTVATGTDTTRAAGVGTLWHDLETGDCFDLPENFDDAAGVDVVPCDSPHMLEVVAVTGAGDLVGFPGVDEVEKSAIASCVEPFERYVGVPWTESGLGSSAIWPDNADSWRTRTKTGRGAFTCIAWRMDGQPLEASVEGSGGVLEPDEATLYNLRAGQCYNDPVQPGGVVVEVVDCRAEHDNETLAVVEYPAEPVAGYPGSDLMQSFGERECAAAFRSSVDPDLRDELDYLYFWFEEVEWWQGHRSVLCAAYRLDLHPLAGSVVAR